MPTNVLLQNSYGAGLEDRRRNALLDQQMQAQQQDMQQRAAMAPLQRRQAALSNDKLEIGNQAQAQINAAGVLRRSLRQLLNSPNILQDADALSRSDGFVSQISALGGDPQQFSISLEGPNPDTEDSIRQEIMQFLPELDRVLLGAGSAPSQVQTMEYLTSGMSPQDVDKARRINLGLESRAGQARVIDVNGVKTLVVQGPDGLPLQVPLTDIEGETEGRAALSGADRLGDLVGTRLDEGLTAARDSVAELRVIDEASSLLDQGIITGTGADIRREFGRALATAGIGEGDEVARTDAYMAATAELVGKVIRAFGSGTGLSDADREFAQRMAAGSANLTPEGMRRILDIRRKAATAQIQGYNDLLERVTGNEQFSGYGTLYQPIQTQTSPNGGTPKRIRVDAQGNVIGN